MAYNIIFIDDSESMQKAVATIFMNNAAFNLNSISEPSSLFKIAEDFHPDIIILSYNSVNTGINGNISEIKKSEGLSGTPILLLAPSDLSDNERELLLKRGVNGFIYRPFEKEAFLLKIKRMLGITVAAEKADENGAQVRQDQLQQGSKIYDISLFEANKHEGENVINLMAPEIEPEIEPDLNKPAGENIISENKIPTKGEAQLEILDEQSLLKLDELLKNSIQRALEEIKPQVSKNIKNVLPEIIEKLVKEEIEKIKQAETNN